jgi:hypothetical protein
MNQPAEIPVRSAVAAAMKRRLGFACAEAIVALALFASLCALVLLIGRGLVA